MIQRERLRKNLEEISRLGKTQEGWNRLAYTEIERKAVQFLLGKCQEIGLETRVDSIGNVYARWDGEHPELPVVICGSHLDTVRNGGPLDGTLGVMVALEVVTSLKEQGITPYYPLELVAFACEESSRFGMATIGSKAITGLLSEQQAKTLVDQDGVTFEEALRHWDYKLSDLSSLKRNDLRAYLELHIEQGPILEATEDTIGIATAIAAPTRLKIKIQGIASHSGATAMSFRYDALPAAAEFILMAEKLGRSEEVHGTVVTVGVCEVFPGAMNVVPGEVRLQVDIRSIDIVSKQRVVNELNQGLKEITERRKLTFDWVVISAEVPVYMSEELNEEIAQICLAHKIPYRMMPSGAGHDAMNLATICPTALIFVPSEQGISHNPAEYTKFEDIEMGAKIYYEILARWIQMDLVARHLQANPFHMKES